MLSCRKCGETKPDEDFEFRNDSGKRRTECCACRANGEAARRVGITVGEVERLKKEQDNRCAICNTPAEEVPHQTFRHNPLVIDHDHGSGKVRGLLCPTCNQGLGQFKDSPALLESAQQYLVRTM